MAEHYSDDTYKVRYKGKIVECGVSVNDFYNCPLSTIITKTGPRRARQIAQRHHLGGKEGVGCNDDWEWTKVPPKNKNQKEMPLVQTLNLTDINLWNISRKGMLLSVEE